MSTLFADTIPLALGAAISPVVFLFQLTTLTGSRPLARGLALAAGAAVPLVVVGVAAVTIGHSASLSGSPTVKAALDLGLGVLLVGLGLRALLKAPKPPSPKPDHDKPKGAGRSFAMGVVGMGTNVTTFALYIPALKFIAASDVSLGQKGVVGLIVLVIVLAPALIPLALTALAPKPAGHILTAIGHSLTAHQRVFQIALGFGFGGWLVVRGVTGL